MSVIFAFDESIPTLIERSRNLNMDLESYVAAGTMELRQVNPAELSPGEFIDQVRKYVAERKARVVVIDSINGFLNAMPNEQFLSMQLHEMLAYLGQQGVATILTLAQHGMLGSSMISPVDISYRPTPWSCFDIMKHAAK